MFLESKMVKDEPLLARHRQATTRRPDAKARQQRKGRILAAVANRVRALSPADKAAAKVRKAKYNAALNSEEINMTHAVEFALMKMRATKPCLRPHGYLALKATLSPAAKKRRPAVKGQRCIAMPQGTPGGVKKKKAPSWTPCTFERTYSLNGDPNTLAILRRTDGEMLANRSLKQFFCVNSQDVYSTPDEFPPGYEKQYSPMRSAGVYAVVNKTGTGCYVGISNDIEKRVLAHNGLVSARGASYTLEGRPWSRVNLLTNEKDHKSKLSWESREFLAQRKVYGVNNVRGSATTQKVLSQFQLSQ